MLPFFQLLSAQQQGYENLYFGHSNVRSPVLWVLEAILCSEGRASNVFLKCISDFSDYGEEESTAHAQICEQLADAGVFMHKI